MPIKPLETAWYGWKPQLPDQRDYKFTYKAIPLPAKIDLREDPSMPSIWNQGALGSCVAFSTCAAFEFGLNKQHLPSLIPSTLFVYCNGRLLEGTTDYDSGLYVRDGLKSVGKYGTVAESKYPYIIEKFADKPLNTIYTEAYKNRAINYYSVKQDLVSIKTALKQNMLVVFGFTVYESFESLAVEKTGIVPLPKKTEYILGGHSVVIVGYDDVKKWFICRNSWDTDWGAAGYFYMPYNYVINKNLCSDFWVIRQVTEDNKTSVHK